MLAICLQWGWTGAAARQAAEVNVAGIVIDFGNGDVAYALVPFTEETLAGIDLLHRSGIPLLTVEFGAMGEGVCMIQETGCDVGPCRARLCQTGDPDSPFWQYVQASETGEWSFAALGPAASEAGNGDVEGWFWTGETPDGAAMTLEAVAAKMGVDLASFRSDAADGLEAIVDSPEDDDEPGFDRWTWLAGAGIVGGVGLLGGWTVLRSRRGQRV